MEMRAQRNLTKVWKGESLCQWYRTLAYLPFLLPYQDYPLLLLLLVTPRHQQNEDFSITGGTQYLSVSLPLTGI